jgi:Flp pilus assembly protein TadD
MAVTGTPREMGLQLLREGSFDESIDFLLQSDVDVHLYLALAYARHGEAEKSVEVLEQATVLAPKSAKVHYNLGVAYHMVGNLTQAKDSYLRASNLDPNYAPAQSALEKLSA